MSYSQKLLLERKFANKQSIDETDTNKLHAEILQLRNQQFQLGTIALAGSGITSWIAPTFSAITEKVIP